MKTQTRLYSASNRKGSQSQDTSPIGTPHLKKESNNIFQMPDINNKLKQNARSTNKADDVKLLTANVFINNLNIQIKPQNDVKKSPMMAHTGNNSIKRNTKYNPYIPQNDDNKRITHEGLYHSPNTEQTNYGHMMSNSPFTSKRELASLLSKNPEPNLTNSNILSHLRPNLGDKSNMKSPGKIFSPFEATTKKKTHTKNQKSLDVNLIASQMSKKVPNYPSSYSKPPTAENSPRSQEIDRRESFSQNHPLYNRMAKTPVLDKSPLASKLGAGNQLRHKKSPSMDSGKVPDLISQKLISDGPILDRVRKSADQGDLRNSMNNPSGISDKEKSAPKLLMRYAVRTRAGVMHNGMRKINQDSYIAHTNFGKKKDRYFFGVCDGHGVNGHFVSGFVKETLPTDHNFDSEPKAALSNAFDLCQQKLLVCDFDCKFSGTTCVTMIIDGTRVITANAGDSRIILGQYKKGWTFNPLTMDHKPNLIGEAQRILKAGGRIEPFKDGDGNYVGPSRVWLLHQDIPGLAMSRSIGDIVASTVGVTSHPEIKEFNLGPDDKFMIVASDGVWEFLENMDIIKLVAPYYEQNNLEGACDLLMNASVKRWQEEEDTIVDDITLIIIFFYM